MAALTVDLESRCLLDIKTSGSWAYWAHPSAEVLIGSFYLDGRHETKDMTKDKSLPDWVVAHLEMGGLINAFGTHFEYSAWFHKHAEYGWPMPKVHQWRDTQAKCCASAFPANLEDAAMAMDLAQQKDKRGKTHITYFSKPHDGKFRDPAASPDRFAEFMEYCAQDVRTTVAVDNYLRDLSPHELRFWQVTFKRNIAGIKVDLPLIRNLQALAEKAKGLYAERLESETDGAVSLADIPNHRKLLDYVKSRGSKASGVSKKAVREILADNPDAAVKAVLETRQALGKTSISKLGTILDSANDGWLRFNFRAFGCATGRDSSQGAQLQNIPRGEKMPIEDLISSALAGDADRFFALAKQKTGQADPLGGIVSCMRGCLVAQASFLQCDWSAVEPRIIAWLSGETKILDMFRRIDTEGGTDCYQESAAPFFNKDPAAIKGDERQFGKVYFLQNQYQSSWVSVQRAAKDQYRLDMDEDLARLCVDVYRATYTNIVDFWANLDRAAMQACRYPNKVMSVGKVAFCHDGLHLRMRLPGGRLRTYPYSCLIMATTPWGTEREQVTYMGIVKGNWVACRMHGGAWANNATQGTGATLMQEKAIALGEAGFNVVLRAHDEMVTDDKAERFEEFKQIMLTPPTWAPDLPLNGGGWIGPRFKKD